ncbi:hypothetical protein Q8O96_12500 [Pseudomonas sp. LPH60]|uniref:hypothetical protein n=1 Tax=Pseudomonas sp. LPH60 TaxID=3065906 RepID=UPI00273CCCAF|nr:hypothetical protein [Pseudomonas sp. LPH60]MDP4569868.1 hypothetical protein [Pseudomonas sp. LPH60]
MTFEPDLVKAIIVAVIGGVFGAWLTSIRSKWTAFSADYSKRLEHAFVLIDHFAECSCIWWEGIDPSDKLKASPTYIIGLKTRLSTLITSMDRDYPGFNTEAVNNAYVVLGNACTGGDFPSKAPAQNSRATEILKCAELLKAELFAVRRRDYSMRLTMKK